MLSSSSYAELLGEGCEAMVLNSSGAEIGYTFKRAKNILQF